MDLKLLTTHLSRLVRQEWKLIRQHLKTQKISLAFRQEFFFYTLCQNKYSPYQVIVHTNEGQNFSATFVDQSDGEIYDIDTLEAQSSALPVVIIAAVARYGISYAIKRFGKKAVTNAIRSKSFDKVLSSVSRLDANSRKHILDPKHDWHKVTKNNWDDVAKVMSYVMRYGKEEPYKKNGRQKTLNINGPTVTITFVREKGKIKISNGWVNK